MAKNSPRSSTPTAPTTRVPTSFGVPMAFPSFLLPHCDGQFAKVDILTGIQAHLIPGCRDQRRRHAELVRDALGFPVDGPASLPGRLLLNVVVVATPRLPGGVACPNVKAHTKEEPQRQLAIV